VHEESSPKKGETASGHGDRRALESVKSKIDCKTPLLADPLELEGVRSVAVYKIGLLDRLPFFARLKIL